MATTIAASVVRPPRRAVYVGLSVLMAAIAIGGFWPKYFGPLVFGTLVQPLLIHIHAIVFTGWLALFFAQAYFAATKRIQWHLKAGQIGMWYALLLIVVGLTTGAMRAAGHVAEGGGTAQGLLYAATADMVVFAGFFGTAIWYRKKPKLHRPAMVVAATALLIAPVARMTFLPPPPGGIPIRLFVWSLPVLVAMAVDFRKTRTVHPIYLIGLAVFLVRRYSAAPVGQTAAWGSFAHWVFGLIS